jgi:Vitamin K-dependent gamma-carboxylase
MTLSPLRDAWNRFFFSKQSPLPIALFRIVYGALVIVNLLFLRPDWLEWFGTRAWVSLSTMQAMEPGIRLNLFTLLPQSDASILAFFWLFLISAFLLTTGFLTRLNTIIVFLCLASIHERNLFITHGGDTFLRVAGFFLIFAPAGAALSIDRLLRVWRGREDAAIPLSSPWAQRMIQIQLSLLYIAAFCWKVQGAPWQQGTALFYVYHLDALKGFPVPAWFLRPTVLKLGTWFAVALELSLGVLIWIKKIRYVVLLFGLLFHLWLEYSLNTPLFQWDVLSAYILFIDPSDLTYFANRITRRKRSPVHEKSVTLSA